MTKKTQQASKSETKVSAVTSAPVSTTDSDTVASKATKKDYNSENYYCKNYYHCKDNNCPCYDHNACGDYYQEKRPPPLR